MKTPSSQSNRFATAAVIAGLSLGLGLAFNYFFFAKLPGLAFPVFVVLIVAGLFAIGGFTKQRLSRAALWLLVPLVFFSSMVAVRASLTLLFLNVLASLMLLLLIAAVALGGKLRAFQIGDYVKVCLLPLQFLRPLGRTLGDLYALGIMRRDQKVFAQVIKGVIITLPVLILFLLLLSSADLIFQKYVLSIVNFNLKPETLVRAILVILATLGLTGAYTYAFSRIGAAPEGEPKAPVPHLGRIESSILVGSVNVLFLAFILIQIAYLFGGQSNISVQGFTYAEYARKGFFELIFVAVISFFLLWGAERQTAKTSPAGHSLLFKLLSNALILQVVLIMASAFKRLWLYEEAYGFTSLRLYSHAFIFLLAAVFVLLLIKILRGGRDNTFAFGVFLSVIAFVVALNALNPDAFIARQNIHRFATTGKLDTGYLANLSADATPETVKALNLSDQNLANSLAHELSVNRADQAGSPRYQGWQAWNLSRSNGTKILDAHSLRP